MASSQLWGMVKNRFITYLAIDLERKEMIIGDRVSGMGLEASAGAIVFVDDFNRPDGPVGNGCSNALVNAY